MLGGRERHTDLQYTNKCTVLIVYCFHGGGPGESAVFDPVPAPGEGDKPGYFLSADTEIARSHSIIRQLISPQSTLLALLDQITFGFSLGKTHRIMSF